MTENDYTQVNYLVVVPNYWGKSDVLSAAWARVREESGKYVRILKQGPYAVYRVHASSYCEGIRGDIVHPKGHPPVLIEDKDGPGKPVRLHT